MAKQGREREGGGEERGNTNGEEEMARREEEARVVRTVEARENMVGWVV